MRYTTIIDISEIRQIYKSVNTRLVYLHLCLRSGYHDTDRDIVDLSIRKLAMQCGLTVSATRHALSILAKARLIERQGAAIKVAKWLQQEPITPRARTRQQQQLQDAAAARMAQERKREREAAKEAAERAALRAQGKTQYQVYLDDLQRRAAAGDIQAIEALKRHKHTKT